MLKKRKAISLLVAFMFCLSFMAPAFIAPDVAEAGCTYTVVEARTVAPLGKAPWDDVGIVKVELDDTVVSSYSILTVSMPSDFNFPENKSGSYSLVPVVNSYQDGGGIQVIAPGGSKGLVPSNFMSQLPIGSSAPVFVITSNNTFDIKIGNLDGISGDTTDRYFYIYFRGIDLNNLTGDIKVDLLPPSGSSGFSFAKDLVIGKSTRDGSTLTTCKDVKPITDKGGVLDIITIHESTANTLEAGKNIKMKILTKGFEWDGEETDNAEVSYGWEWFSTTSKENINTGDSGNASIKENGKLLEYKLNSSKMTSRTESGKVSFLNLPIKVDDSKVESGDELEIKISGANMDTVTLIVAKYADYGIRVEEGTTKTLIAGQNDQEIGEFYIEEGAADSLVEGRVIKLTLPAGVEWNEDALGEIETEVVSGDSVTFKDAAVSGSNNEVLKFTVDATSNNKGAKIKFKDMKVNVAPDFRDDLKIEVSGSAGVEGSVKIAEVVSAATIEVDKVNNVILGKPNQKIGDLTITEGAVEALLDGKDIILELDEGYRFAKTPVVKLAEGDLDIKVDNVDADGRVLTIPVTGQSSKTAGKMEISEIYLDAFRTAPEGPVEIKFANRMQVQNVGDTVKYGTTALNETRFDKSSGKAVIANCVTAALGETLGNGQFVISSNIYEMNGVKKVMDVAPYIKNDRTYVPVRYLGYVLGLTDDNIIWDESSQKVTFTRGDDTVELVIGSTTITVNGEEQVMDVAPEISNDRTMLPARYVAEGFGFNVGWDATTQTVLISN